jgi:hypothetical protein
VPSQLGRSSRKRSIILSKLRVLSVDAPGNHEEQGDLGLTGDSVGTIQSNHRQRGHRELYVTMSGPGADSHPFNGALWGRGEHNHR